MQAPPPVVKAPEAPPAYTGPTSLARTSKEYRKDAAAHLYGHQAHRIYKGRLPPMLEAALKDYPMPVQRKVVVELPAANKENP